MLPVTLVLFTALAYFLVLFSIASRGERRRQNTPKPWRYTLVLGVHCTTWAFYGTVTQAAHYGWGFAPTYAGAILVFLFAHGILMKTLSAVREHNLTSIADFIGSRYSKSNGISAAVAIIALIALVPYISLQLRAITASFSSVTGAASTNIPLFTDPQNIFNPGKIVDSFKMDEALRYVADRKEPQIKTLMDFEDYQGILRLAENCNGSGDCRKSADATGAMCPSYQATKNEKDTTRARANMLREVLTNNKTVNKFDSEDLKEVMDLCISCKACSSECPSNVDISTAKAEFLYQYHKAHGVSFSDKLFAKSTKINKLASIFPKLSNWVYSNSITSRIIRNIGGVHQKRSLPKISSESFQSLFRGKLMNFLGKNSYKGKTKGNVLLFVDEFSNYLDAEIAEDSYLLLSHLGYNVTVIDTLDSGRAMISKGFLDEAKAEVNKNILFLKDKVSENVPLLGIEPSAILSFRDEYLRLADDKTSAESISKHTFLIEEFLAKEIEKGNITSVQFTSEEKHIKIHSHCHQKSLSNQKVTFDILNLPKNYKPTIITSGCCGMAGSFGFEKEHYEISMQIGELKLFPSVRKSTNDIIIAANGTSCRHQILDGTGRQAIHPVTVLKNALL